MKVNYSKNWNNKSETPLLTGGVSQNVTNITSLNLDMSQSAYATIQIEGITGISTKYFKNFIPIKTLGVNHGTLETLSLPIGIFSDLAFAYRRSLQTIQITCMDKDTDYYENSIINWYNSSINVSGYVGYLNEIVRKININMYNVKGSLNKQHSFFAMLKDNVNSTRTYDSNSLKEFTFSLVVLGTA